MSTQLPHHDINAACTSAAAAFSALSHLSTDSRAAILDAIAAALDAQRDLILKTTADETALTIEELTPEFARMTGTLRMFATLIREGSWVRAAIDTPATTPIGPNHDLRKLLIPLGPVAVFGSSNFPLAYGVCGGDTASALAAGCPVIIKEHPAHPKTGRLLASIAQAAIQNPRGHAGAKGAAHSHHAPDTSQAPAFLQYIHNEDPKDFSVAQQLVQNQHITAVGFTGSTTGGLALESLAQQRRYPIPVYAEMGSLNSVFVCAAAARNRAESIADELASSILARVGQQCTKPGLIFVVGEAEHRSLYQLIRDRLLSASPRRMLAATVSNNYYRRLDSVAASAAITEHSPLPNADQRAAGLGAPVVFSSSDFQMEYYPETWEEIFGPAVIVAQYKGSAQFFLRGALTQSVYADAEDFDDPLGGAPLWAFGLGSNYSARAGRIIFNGPPTGVRVATSTVHGGPFPATNRPDTTAVGPLAIERWCRPICYQNCPDSLLPPELQNANPRHIWRTLNFELTRSPVP